MDFRTRIIGDRIPTVRFGPQKQKVQHYPRNEGGRKKMRGMSLHVGESKKKGRSRGTNPLGKIRTSGECGNAVQHEKKR